MDVSRFALMGQTDWSMVGALAASLGVIVALFCHIRSLAHTQLSNSAKMVLELVDQFEGPDMRRFRREFAQLLLDNPDSLDLQRNTPVTEFFEEIGYMTRRGVLDKRMVWNSFSWWLEGYYLAVTTLGQDQIKLARSHSHCPTLYREIEWLHRTLRAVSRREEGVRYYFDPRADEITAFLQDEAALDSQPGDRLPTKKNEEPPARTDSA